MNLKKLFLYIFSILSIDAYCFPLSELILNKTEYSCHAINKRKSEKNLFQQTPLKYYYSHYDYRLARFRKRDRAYLIGQLAENNIQYIQFGDTVTVVIPTDEYFKFNSSVLNDFRFSGLNYVVNLINLSPCSQVYVAAFSDDVSGREKQNRLTQARAESMLTFLWANLIPAEQLHAQGNGSKYPIADNSTIRGSAMNRRIEIQWLLRPDETLGDVTKAMK